MRIHQVFIQLKIVTIVQEAHSRCRKRVVLRDEQLKAHRRRPDCSRVALDSKVSREDAMIVYETEDCGVRCVEFGDFSAGSVSALVRTRVNLILRKME